MKVYLAAPFSWKDQVNVYATELREAGLVVTSRWLEEPHKPTIQMTELTHEQHLVYAMQDIEDVQAADVLVFFTDPTRRIVRGGRHVEFGIAVQMGIPICVLGDHENIFHHLPQVTHFYTWPMLKVSLLAAEALL